MPFNPPYHPINSFRGEAKPIDAIDIPIMAHRIGVGEDHLRAFVEVEAAGRGFDNQGRPKMLFEPHVFYRNLKGAERDLAVDAGLAYKSWGQKPYPKDSYPRLAKAMEINQTAALMSASVGLSQILGENYEMIGYESPQEMWEAFMDDEEAHVEGMVNYILATGLADDIRAERWATVARTYNGPGYRKNDYDGKMARAFAKFQKEKDMEIDASTPAEEAAYLIPDSSTIRAVQKRLRELGYLEVGKVDGQWGTRTRAAILAFRYEHGLELAPIVDDEFLAFLMVGEPRPVAPERAGTTVNDVRKEGSRTIAAADKAQGAGLVAAVVAVLGGISGEDFLALPDILDALKPALEALSDQSPILVIGAAVFILWQQYRIKKARVDDERKGANVGRG